MQFSQPVVAQCLLKPHTVAEGPHVEEHTDAITDVLRECEETLRALAVQGRLTDAALAAFIRLAHSVEQEIERRRGSERRREVRSSADRRSGRNKSSRIQHLGSVPPCPKCRTAEI